MSSTEDLSAEPCGMDPSMVVSMGDERCEGGQGVLSKACRDEVRRAIEANLLLEGFAHIFTQQRLLHRLAKASKPVQSAQSLEEGELPVAHGSSMLAVQASCSESPFPLQSLATPSHHRFISYNWSGSRQSKWWTLIYLLNFRKFFSATVAGWVAAMGVGVPLFVWSGPARAWVSSSLEPPNVWAMYNTLYVVITLVAALLLVFGQVLPFSDRRPVFLDRLCISQTDRKLREEGVAAIGAILQKTERLTYFGSERYFERLWCVYEVATFICRHGDAASIEIMFPTQGILLVLIIASDLLRHIVNLLCCSVGDIVDPRTAAYSVLAAQETLYASFCVVVLALGMLKFARERQLIHRQLQTFDVRETACTVEGDRPIVLESICSEVEGYLRRNGLPPVRDGDQLDVFNQLVRTKIATRVREINGCWWQTLPVPIAGYYAFCVCIKILYSSWLLDVACPDCQPDGHKLVFVSPSGVFLENTLPSFLAVYTVLGLRPLWRSIHPLGLYATLALLAVGLTYAALLSRIHVTVAAGVEHGGLAVVLQAALSVLLLVLYFVPTIGRSLRRCGQRGGGRRGSALCTSSQKAHR